MKNPTNLENALYQNAVMGVSAIKKVYPKVTDRKLKNELRSQFNEYKRQTSLISGQLRRKHTQPQEVPLISKLAANAGISYNCYKDNSPANMAKMMINGTNMGIIKVTKALNSSTDDNQRFKSEARNILYKEQKYIDKLKGFL